MASETDAITADLSSSSSSSSSLVLVLAFGLAVVLSALLTFCGHKKFFTNLVVGSLLGFIGLAFLVLEIVFLAATPVRLLLKKPRDPKAGTNLSIKDRKVVLFDGVCVLCNRAGQFVLLHLPDPQLVNFLPYQDALSNPHVNLARLKLEFPVDLANEERIGDEICVVSGEKIFWGAESVMEVCRWMHFPFPVTYYVGLAFPKSVRDLVYNIVSRNRKEWFGTQDIERNFAKGLCPYLQVRKFMSKEE